jgi:hypothetical protein
MSFRRKSVWIACLLPKPKCWKCQGSVHLIGREFRALALKHAPDHVRYLGRFGEHTLTTGT